MPFLDPVAIAKLESMPLRARVIVEGALSGQHRARLHGSSVEFAEHKEYSPGDEIRHIDWKAYGKLDRYYVKQFEQESELTTFLVLDATGSMGYRGDGVSKLEYASFLLSSLAYLLIRQRDRVGLLVFGGPTGEAIRYIPPRARATHLHDLLGIIEETNSAGAAGDTPIAPVLERVAEPRAKPALSGRARIGHVRQISRAAAGAATASSAQARRRVVSDPRRPRAGLAVFRADSVRGARKRATHARRSGPPCEASTSARCGSFSGAVRGECVGGGVEHHLIATSKPVERTLLDFLTARVRGGGVPASEDAWNF